MGLDNLFYNFLLKNMKENLEAEISDQAIE